VSWLLVGVLLDLPPLFLCNVNVRGDLRRHPRDSVMNKNGPNGFPAYKQIPKKDCKVGRCKGHCMLPGLLCIEVG
jgi:hypothetical protein